MLTMSRYTVIFAVIGIMLCSFKQGVADFTRSASG